MTTMQRKLTWDELKAEAAAAGVPIAVPGKKGARSRKDIEAELAGKSPIALEGDEPPLTRRRSADDDLLDKSQWINYRVKGFRARQHHRDGCEIMDVDGNVIAIFRREGDHRAVLPMKRYVKVFMDALNKEGD